MNVEKIRIVVPEVLLSAKFDEFETDEMSRIFDLWTDVGYLEAFFHDQYGDLRGEFYGESSIEEAVLATLKHAHSFEKLIRIWAAGHNGRSLNELFRPYDNKSIEKLRERSKARGAEPRSWLRLYAIRLDDNLFVIAGGAIKLTKHIDRPHLRIEDQKMRILASYFKSQQIDSRHDYGFIDFYSDED